MFSCRKDVDESLQSSVVEKFVACKADLLGGVPGGIALFRGSCVVLTVKFGDLERICTGWSGLCRVFTAKSGVVRSD